jgi:hypothetical protein
MWDDIASAALSAVLDHPWLFLGGLVVLMVAGLFIW